MFFFLNTVIAVISILVLLNKPFIKLINFLKNVSFFISTGKFVFSTTVVSCLFLCSPKLPSILLRKIFFYVINIDSNIIIKRIKGDNNKAFKYIHR